jgi:5-methylthioribose kinase
MFFLSPSESSAITSFLQERAWLQPGEAIQRTERGGEGNMNCVVRVRTNRRSFILKQSRPWVEKYPQIAAPWDRALIEARFYRETEENAELRFYLPRLLALDPEERLLMFEDLGRARDWSDFYRFPEEWSREADFDALIRFLAILHTSFRDPALRAAFTNIEMRQLNYEHIFALPLQQGNGLTLDSITPGLAQLAEQLQANSSYVTAVAELGRTYLNGSPQACLLHGDYFPGSWLRTEKQFYVIDPEFCFYGPPEWDLGVMAAHLYLAGQPAKLITSVTERYSALAPLRMQLMRQFAGVEIMRRLIGVAQLPLLYGFERKRELLQVSVDLVLGGSAA